MDRELLRALPGRREPARGAGRRTPSPAPPAAPPAATSSRLSFLVEDERIASVSFDAEGCGATEAATAAVAETIDGAPVLEAAALDVDAVEAAIGGLTPAKRHAAVLAADALHRALAAAARPRRLRVGGPRLTAGSARHRASVPSASPSPCPAASTAPSPRCSSASAGRRWSGSRSSSGPTRRPTGPRPAARRRRCSAPAALAHSLGIPHFTLDLEEEFRRRVVGRFIDGYAAGSTPNPCVLCNGEVRIAAMVDLAERLGADRLVTGHYARIVEDADGPLLASAADAAKDQSYMLAALPPRPARPARLPAHRADQAARCGRSPSATGSPSPSKAESQDLCFLAGQGKRGFLRRHGGLSDRDGAVARRGGRTVGRHRGHHNFTVGQRRGIGVSGSGAALRGRHRRRRQHGHGRDPGGASKPAASTSATPSCTATAPASTRSACATTRALCRPRSAAAGAGRHEALEIELGEEFVGASPGPDGGAAGGRDDRRPRHDRRPGLSPGAGPAASAPRRYLGSLT